jgi:TonB family protein
MKLAAVVAVTVCLPLSVAEPSAAVSARQGTEPVYEPGHGVTTPVLVHQPPMMFPPSVTRQRRQVEVWLEGVVRADGSLTDIRVVRALEPETDRIARETFAKWEFRPGTKDGKPVAVRVTVTMAYTSLDEAKPDPVFAPGSNVAPPAILTEVKPAYPDDVREAGVTGNVGLECVVRRDGAPTDIVVTKILHPALDKAAVDALRQWRFKPGMSKGAPVSVRIQLTMSFEVK